MSYLAEQEIACPHCKHPNNAEIWSSINVHDDPELKDILLGGELNMVECEACHNVFYAEHFLLYHDPDNELLAFVYPYENRNDRDAWEEKTKVDFQRTQELSTPDKQIKYEPVSLFGLDELVRLVEHEEEMDIQGEIVSLLSKDNGFDVRRLAPALARKQNLPKVIPLQKDPSLSSREAIIAALSVVQQLNDRLTVYTEAKKRLSQNLNEVKLS